MTTSTSSTQCYLITGANSGVGLEATRQLASFLASKNNNGNHNNTKFKIYMLCRSEQKANDAIKDIRNSIEMSSSSKNTVQLEFLKFNADDTPEQIQKECVDKLNNNNNNNDDDDESIIDIRAILLNAGGFGDDVSKKEQNQQQQQTCSSSSSIARSNIIGHAILIDRLLKSEKLKEKMTNRVIVASGSEAAFASGIKMDFETANFEDHLMGTAKNLGGIPGVAYGWTKAILALYWAAFARKHDDFFVVTVSPGSVKSTNLLQHGGVSPMLRRLSQMAMFVGGSHSVQDAAKRYVDAILLKNDNNNNNTANDTQEYNMKSGSFWASRKGYTKDYGDVATLKTAKFVSDEALQDKAYDAVNKFLQ